MKIEELNAKQLQSLRQQILFCSLFISDYKNTFNISPVSVCDFFDGYAEYLQELMQADGKDGNNKFFDYVDEYDTPQHLTEYKQYIYSCTEDLKAL